MYRIMPRDYHVMNVTAVEITVHTHGTHVMNVTPVVIIMIVYVITTPVEIYCPHSWFLQSSLLQCLLGELKPLKGSVELNGRVSYASQTPWVFSGTLQENILFGAPLDKERYNKVVDACALRQVSFIDVSVPLGRCMCVCPRKFHP